MPSRIVYRTKGSSRSRASTVVPGGFTKRVRKGVKSNAPVYAYQPPKVALRKLIHNVTYTVGFRVNGAGGAYPASYANMLCASGIGQGDGLGYRHANKAFLKDLQLNWGHGVTAPSSVPFYYGLSVVYDRESRGVVPLVVDIYETASYDSMQRIDNRDRFDIIYRKIVAVAPEYCWNGTTMYPQAGLSWMKNFSESIPVNRMTTYSTSGDAYTDILKGALWVIVHGNLVAGASNPAVYATSRLLFVDVE